MSKILNNLVEGLAQINDSPEGRSKKNACREYYRINIGNMTDDEILTLYDYPDLAHERLHVAKNVENRINKNIEVSKDLVVKVASEGIKNFNNKNLRDTAFRKGLLENIENPSDSLKEYLKVKNTNKHIKEGALLLDKTLKEMIGDGSGKLYDYVPIALRHNNIEQLTQIFDYNANLALGMTRYQLNREMSELFIKYKPDSVSQHLNIFDEDTLMNFIVENFQKIDFRASLFSTMPESAIEKISQIAVDSFNKSPDVRKALNCLEALGDRFYDKTDYDFRGVLTAPSSRDLSSDLTKVNSMGDTYQVRNILYKSLTTNMLQSLIINGKTSYANLVRDYIDLFNIPVKEVINGLQYPKEILDYVFLSGENHQILNHLTSSLHLLNDEQHKRVAFMALDDFYQNNKTPNFLSNLPKDKIHIYKEANNLMSKRYGNISEISALLLDLELDKKTEIKKVKI